VGTATRPHLSWQEQLQARSSAQVARFVLTICHPACPIPDSYKAEQAHGFREKRPNAG